MNKLAEISSNEKPISLHQHPEIIKDYARQISLSGHEDEYEQPENNINIEEYWRIINKHKWHILLVLTLSVTLIITATMMMTPIYRSSLLLQIERNDPKITNFDNVTPSETGLSDQQFYQTQYELLKSRSLAQRVVEQLHLLGNPNFNKNQQDNKFWQEWFKWLKPKDTKKSLDPEAPLHQFIDGFISLITIEPVRGSKLIKIHCDLPDPKLAATIVNQLANNFIKLSLERRYNSAVYAKEFLDQRLIQVKAKLEDDEERLAMFTRQQGIIDVGAKQTLTMQKLKSTSEALAEAERERIDAESKYHEASLVTGHGIEKVLDSGVISNLKGDQSKLEGEYQRLLRKFRPDYPELQQLTKEIAENQRHINNEVEAVKTALRTNYQTAKRKEDLLRADYNKLKAEALHLQDMNSSYNILMREVDTSRTLYKGLLKRLKEVGVSAGVTMNNISVIDHAEVPTKKYKPKVILNIIVGALLGLLGGIALAFLLEYLDDSIKTIEDFERAAKLPVLGMVPSFPTSVENDLVAYYDPRSSIAEAYRSVRTALLFSTTSGAPKILSFTSSQSGEGKSTSALNLAITFIQLSHKVLLIDADMRRPILHQRFNLDNSRGLTNFLTGEAKPEDIAHPAAISELTSGFLFVIPAGPIPPNPSELLASPKMTSLLALAAKKFDYVILDGPPVLNISDAVILSSLAHGTVFVVEAGKTSRKLIKHSLKRLHAGRTKIIGGILNKLVKSDSPYGYGSYYYYQADTPAINHSPKKSITPNNAV